MTTAAGSATATRTESGLRGGVGDSPARPDGRQKVTGEFAYSSDLWLDGMLWGATLRSPHPRALITGLDITEALALPGVAAVVTHDDVPGHKTYGLEHKDQPVLASDQVRYQGEPVALVAADHPETARRAVARIAASYEVLPPLTDARAALAPDAPALHEGGNLVRHVRIRKGHPGTRADVVVCGEYQVGMQDQAFLGPESGLAVPAEDGGVDLFVATQWLHVDQGQIAASLGLPPEMVRVTLSGVGGAFGAREDLSMQIHACLLALHAGKPVKMVYSREESFFGHVHRHPALLHYEHGSTAEGRLVYVKADIVLDGGAYASSSPAVAANAATLGVGPYEVPHVEMDCYAAYTDNPPCGAMRGFGAVQACFAYEAQMDKLAAALHMDPVEFRIRNAMREGSVMPTGQVVDSAAPVAEILHLVRSRPLPPAPSAPPEDLDLRAWPGGVSNTTHGEGVVRGVGYAVGIKNVCFSEGFDDYSTARVRLELIAGEPTAQVHTAAAEVGQGLVTVLTQIARTELGVDRVVVLPADTAIGSAGSSSASRQTYVTGGAVRAACLAVKEELLRRGGIAQGLGLAVMEEIQVTDGVVRNPSFTDYLIPTILDMPPVRLDVLELADPHAPYGLRGVGEPPTISSTPAVVAAIRAATGLDLARVPVRPEHITGT
jgi:CO/xanthine dehydrogenase Mo-binding subunit